MSAAARWAYTSKATLWPRAAQGDGWGAGTTWARPVVIDCDYSSEAKTMRDAKGDEFMVALQVFTEHAGTKQGDMLAIGDHGSSAAPVADAREVRAIERHADTFDGQADDYTLITG